MITKKDPAQADRLLQAGSGPDDATPVASTCDGEPAPTRLVACAGVAAPVDGELDEAPQSCSVRRRREVSSLVLNGCISHDEASFAEFVACYQHLVFAILSRRLGCGSHVEDLAQDVFYKAYVAFPHFEIREDTPPSTWLGTIARNAAFDEKRRRGIVTVAAHDPEPAYAPDTSERAFELRQALSELDERQCEALLLHEVEGMSLREVATILDVAPNTVNSLVHDAIVSLRRRLSRRGIAR